MKVGRAALALLCALLPAAPGLAQSLADDGIVVSPLDDGIILFDEDAAEDGLDDTGTDAETAEDEEGNDNTVRLPDGTILFDNSDQDDGVLLQQTRNLSDATSTSAPAAATASGAVLRALDKTMGRSTDIELGSGQTVLFGRIAITLHECRYPVDDPSSDAYAHLEVMDPDGAPIFEGWMVASSPALIAMEHPRYDVWVLRCNTS